MRAHYLQHVPFEGLGSINSWLEAVGAEVTGTRFFEDSALPGVDEVDLLIVMGGPMSVNDETVLPWLVAEKEFIRTVIARNKAVVGVCLGAQLIASAMGAAVYPNGEKEIGWFPVAGVQADNARELFRFPEELLVFHWHGETFALPEGAVRLARSAACENQAFQLGSRVIGLQFHLETTPGGARAMIRHCRDELLPSRYAQTETEILATGETAYDTVHARMDEVLRFVNPDIAYMSWAGPP